jgi:hypothetical protein
MKPAGVGIFLFTPAPRLALGPTQPPFHWVPGVLSRVVKRLGREADLSPPSSAKVEVCVELYLHCPNTSSWRGAQLSVVVVNNNNNNFNNNTYETMENEIKVLELIKACIWIQKTGKGIKTYSNTELSVKNKMQAIGTLPVLVLRYGFGIINWHQEEIQKKGQKNKENANHSWITSPNSRH